MKTPLKDRPELAELLQKSVAAFNAMTPAAKLEMQLKQRKSWVVGNMMLSNPEMTREYVERIYDQVVF